MGEAARRPGLGATRRSGRRAGNEVGAPRSRLGNIRLDGAPRRPDTGSRSGGLGSNRSARDGDRATCGDRAGRPPCRAHHRGATHPDAKHHPVNWGVTTSGGGGATTVGAAETSGTA
jgi:hypothetical protein